MSRLTCSIPLGIPAKIDPAADALQASKNEVGLARTGLDMTALAIGACLLIAASASSGWKSPSVFRPVLWFGQRSYEVYLSHMFIVIGLFTLYIRHGKPAKAAPMVFAATILVAGAWGELLARIYSEPLNRLIRNQLR